MPHRHRPSGEFDTETGRAYLLAAGMECTAFSIADDFDDPLHEDFLLRPLPEP